MVKPDLEAVAKLMIDAVRVFVAKAESVLKVRIDSLEAKIAAIPAGPKGDPGGDGKDGKDADPEAVRQLVAAAVAAIPRPKDGEPGKPGKDGESIKGDRGDPGKDGKDADPEVVKQFVAAAVAALPKPKDGEPGKPGKDGESIKGDRGDPGKDADPLVVRGMVGEEVARAVAALPRPQDGKDAAELEILPSIDEAKSYRRGTWASHNGGLVRASRQTDAVKDGAIVDAGWVVIVEGIAALVVTQDEDMRQITVAAMLTSGTKAVTAFRMPIVLDRGIYKPETEYLKGDGVTWAGSWWIAQIDKPADKPGVSEQWRLAVKRGRDGKDVPK
jgi:hypothetical protein